MKILVFVIGLIGLVAISFGAWSVYEPAGFIVCGLFLLWWSYMAASSARGPAVHQPNREK